MIGRQPAASDLHRCLADVLFHLILFAQRGRLAPGRGPSGDYPALIGIPIIVLVVDAAAILSFLYAENGILHWREIPDLINEGGLASS